MVRWSLVFLNMIMSCSFMSLPSFETEQSGQNLIELRGNIFSQPVSHYGYQLYTDAFHRSSTDLSYFIVILFVDWDAFLTSRPLPHPPISIPCTLTIAAWWSMISFFTACYFRVCSFDGVVIRLVGSSLFWSISYCTLKCFYSLPFDSTLIAHCACATTAETRCCDVAYPTSTCNIL